jgi:hypothetical protein
MTIQLLSISILNVIFILPLNLLALAHLCGLPGDYGAQAEQYLYFAGYLFIFLIPFVSLELTKKIKMKLSCRGQRRVAGGTVTLATNHTNRQR